MSSKRMYFRKPDGTWLARKPDYSLPGTRILVTPRTETLPVSLSDALEKRYQSERHSGRGHQTPDPIKTLQREQCSEASTGAAVLEIKQNQHREMHDLNGQEMVKTDMKGEDLSKEELAELRELKRQYDADKIKWEAERKAAQERQEELEAELKEQSFGTAVSDLIKDVMREYGPAKRRKFSEGAKAQLDENGTRAEERLKAKIAQMRQAGGPKYAKKPEVQLDPDMLNDVSDAIAKQIAKGQINITDIENRLVKDIGPEVRPYMRQAYEEALRRAIKADNDFKAQEAGYSGSGEPEDGRGAGGQRHASH